MVQVVYFGETKMLAIIIGLLIGTAIFFGYDRLFLNTAKASTCVVAVTGKSASNHPVEIMGSDLGMEVAFYPLFEIEFTIPGGWSAKQVYSSSFHEELEAHIIDPYKVEYGVSESLYDELWVTDEIEVRYVRTRVTERPIVLEIHKVAVE